MKDLDDGIKQKHIQRAWDIFRKMGKDNNSGQMLDTSINHDDYFYRQKPS